MEFKSKYGIVHFHDTPWNSRVINGKSLEIEFLESSLENTQNLILEFISKKVSESYILIASRIPCSSIFLKKIYFECGFITIEHTLDVTAFGFDFEKISAISKRFPVDVYDLSDIDIIAIEEISEEEFRFGRFFEDPFLANEAAKIRNKNWVKDLISQQVTIKVLKKNDIVAGFMAYKKNTSRVDFILGGVKKRFQHLSYGFWSSILLELKELKEFRTLISSSNIDVMNLYSYLGFRFENPQFGYHKHLK